MSRWGDEARNWALIVGVAVASAILGYLIGVGRSSPPERVGGAPISPEQTVAPTTPEPLPTSAESTRAVPSPPSAAPPTTAVAPPTGLGPLPSGEGRRIALVIDDLGRKVEDVIVLSELGVPLSFGVLPFEVRTPQVMDELGRRGAEVLLHLPMEPRNGADPGPGALTSGMSRVELEAATRWALGAVSGAAGVNNHMGSGLSTDAESMRAVLAVLAERDLFFLDSRTSPDSVGYTLALEMGLAAAERQVFLDAEAGPEAIRGQFRRLVEIAHSRGSAIAIGHPHAETIAVLQEGIPRAIAAGYEFVTVSTLTTRAGGPELLR